MTGPGPTPAGASAQASTTSSPASRTSAGSERADVGVAGVGHGQGRPADPAGRRDRLLRHDPAAGPHGRRHHAHDGHAGSSTCNKRKRQKARSTSSGRERSSPAWVRAITCACAAGGACHLVARRRVAVDGVDPAVPADHLGQRHRDVATAGADVDTAPTGAEAQARQRGGQRPPVDVVPQALHLAHGVRVRPAPPWPALYGARPVSGSPLCPRRSAVAPVGDR